MSFNDCKISESQIQTTGVQSQPDTLTGSAADNKMVFDALPTLAIQKLNSLIDQMQQQAAAGQIGVTPFDGMTAQTLQEALEQIQADIGGNYGGEDGAGKVGYTPSEGVEEDTVQAAIEAVQANLTAYIAKIKAATGAAEVGNAPIAGMTATNVQHALEELRKNIDNIVSGIIPGGSITSEMIQDGAVTADKLGSDVTGDTIPTSASDPTTISSQLSNLESVLTTPPQKFSLPLAEGWVRVNAAEYWKTQEGVVIVTFRVAPENGAAIDTSIHIIATLPEGFRPNGYTPHIAVSTMNPGTDMYDASAWIDGNGSICAQTRTSIPQSGGSSPTGWAGFAGTFVFVADS